MAKIKLEPPAPPFAELEAAIDKTRRMVARIRGRNKLAIAQYASSLTMLQQVQRQQRLAAKLEQTHGQHSGENSGEHSGQTQGVKGAGDDV